MARSACNTCPENIARARKSDPPEAVALRWFYNSSPAACGLRSNFGAFLIMIQLGGPTGGDPSTLLDCSEEELAAIGRHRVIRAALARCSRRNAKILEAAYEYERREPLFAEELGELAAVAFIAYPSESLHFLASLSGRRASSALRDVRAECKEFLRVALDDFRDALRAVLDEREAIRSKALLTGRA